MWTTRLMRATSTKLSELHLRHDQSEPRPTARLDRSLEPPARLRLVAPHELPVAKAVGECGDLYVFRVRRCEHGVRTDLATIEPGRRSVPDLAIPRSRSLI